MKQRAVVIICMFILAFSMAACGKKDDVNKDSNSEPAETTETTENTDSSKEDKKEEDKKEEEKKGFFDATFTVDTTISYSDGNDNNWAYGNQRKEFSATNDCYVRVGSTAITDKKKGVDEVVTVTYRFTGVENCKVELTDGIGTELNSEDPNIKEFEGKLYPKKKKQAKESIAIFKYNPSGEGSITIEVIYDDNIDPQYDKRNTVYFVRNKTQTKEDNGAH